jgi:hypothetical protein
MMENVLDSTKMSTRQIFHSVQNLPSEERRKIPSKVFVALPTYGHLHYKILDGLFGTIIATPKAKGITIQKECGSLLCAVFNILFINKNKDIVF